MSEEDFFNQLLVETKKQFQISPVRNYQINNNKNWNYAVCETPIQKEKPIIFGLNWGGNDISAQTVHPEFEKEKRDWSFHNNIKHYLQDYLHISNIEELNYSNLCFFRTPNTSYLKNEDWKLSFPLFEAYVNYIKPEFLILLGSVGWSKLKSFGVISNEKKLIFNGIKKRSFGYYGEFLGAYKIGCVPHPQAHISSEARKFIWDAISYKLLQ
ncbi:MAG: hypothetical protein V3U92_13915 [Cellulophaga sp.]